MEKEVFLEKVLECLLNENERRIYNKESLLDIPFMMASLSSYIGDKKYAEFLNDIDEDMDFVKEKRDEYDYSYDYAHIHIYSNNINSDGMYILTFSEDERMWGYCMCEPNMKDYDREHKCCGHGCDWSAPAFSITKQTTIGKSDWGGDEHDYWDYEREFNAWLGNRNVQIEEYKKQLEVTKTQNEIERLQHKLKELKGE